MRNWALAVLTFFSLLFTSCSTTVKSAENEVPDGVYGPIDAVNHHKDPKGGLFGPWLTDVYFQRQDKPQTFCGWQSISETKTDTTIFYRHRLGTSSSIACGEVVKVMPGHVYWNAGKPATEEEMKREEEERRYYVIGRVLRVVPPDQLASYNLRPSIPYALVSMETTDAGPSPYFGLFKSGVHHLNFCAAQGGFPVATKVRIEFSVRQLDTGAECYLVRKINEMPDTVGSIYKALHSPALPRVSPPQALMQELWSGTSSDCMRQQFPGPDGISQFVETVKTETVDLNSDGRSELIVSLTDSCNTGTGGNWVMVYREENGRYKTIADISLASELRPMEGSTHGYRDLLFKNGRGTYFGVYKFDGAEYKAAECFDTASQTSLRPVRCERY